MVTIMEIWLLAEISDHEILPPNYVIIRKDRPSKAGGVAIVLRQNTFLSHMTGLSNVESFCLKLHSSSPCSIVIGAVYKPPNNNTSPVPIVMIITDNYRPILFLCTISKILEHVRTLVQISSKAVCFLSTTA